MITALLIDDEEDARFLLRNKLENIFADSIRIVDEANNVASGIEAINKHNPDVIFLDIQMPDGTGFDLLQKIDNINFEIIFVTAFNEYAIKAFDFSAFGYLMKPIKKDNLQSVIYKLHDRIELVKNTPEKRLKVLVESYGNTDQIKKLVVGNSNGFQVLELDSIYHLKGDGNYTHFLLRDKAKITSSKTLGFYEPLLHEFGFFRIHNNSIVNLRHVKGFFKEDGGLVELKNGDILKLSRRRKADFMKRFL